MNLNIVVTCTDRKSRTPTVRARDLQSAPLEERLERWIAALATQDGGELVAANDLYLGEHWQIASALPELASNKGVAAQLWIASAGYGLIASSARVKAYGATFTARTPDSVVRAGDARDAAPQWWKGLSRWPGPDPDSPQTLAQLAASSPDATLLVVASGSYMRAFGGEVANASAQLSDPASLLVVSAGLRTTSELGDHLLPADARLQHALGGSRQSLNARIATWLINTSDQHEWDAQQVRRGLADLLRTQPELRQFSRQPLETSEVARFIESELTDQPSAPKSTLLRKLRDSGRACEQKRFGMIYDDVVRSAR